MDGTVYIDIFPCSLILLPPAKRVLSHDRPADTSLSRVAGVADTPTVAASTGARHGTVLIPWTTSATHHSAVVGAWAELAIVVDRWAASVTLLPLLVAAGDVEHSRTVHSGTRDDTDTNANRGTAHRTRIATHVAGTARAFLARTAGLGAIVDVAS